MGLTDLLDAVTRPISRIVRPLVLGAYMAVAGTGCGGNSEGREYVEPTCENGLGNHLDCADDEVCVRQQCESAYERSYSVKALFAKVSGRKPSGTTWDSGSGLPDLYVSFRYNNGILGNTAVVNDSLETSWNEKFAFLMVPHKEFEITLYDADEGDDDLILYMHLPSEEAISTVRNGQVAGGGTDYKLIVQFDVE